jgi:predicted nucleic acid-binding protein
MIAVDSNLLIYAHRRGVSENRRALRALQKASEHPPGWGIALASVGEFWTVVTHPSARGGPSRPAQANAFLRALMREAGMQVWTPGTSFAARLMELAEELGIRGAFIFDLQIALTALEAGANELWTHDANFLRLPTLRVRDPL